MAEPTMSLWHEGKSMDFFIDLVMEDVCTLFGSLGSFGSNSRFSLANATERESGRTIMRFKSSSGPKPF